MIQELISAINCASVSMFPIVFAIGIQSGCYIYQLTRIPLVMGNLMITSINKKYAMLNFLSFITGMVFMINILGVILSMQPRFNIIFSLWTDHIYLILASICISLGIILSGIFAINERFILHFFSRHPILCLDCSFFLGAVFSLMETPICPTCGSNLTFIAVNTLGKGNTFQGIILFSLYALGEGLPLFLVWLIIHVLWNDLMKGDTLARESIIFITGLLLIISSSLYFWTR